MVADKSKVKKRRLTKAEKEFDRLFANVRHDPTMTEEKAEIIREQLNRGDISWFLEETD